jgi:hypothetical protein
MDSYDSIVPVFIHGIRGIIMKKIIILLLPILLVTTCKTDPGLFTFDPENAPYLKAWKSDYADTFEDPGLKIIANAMLAPNPHNMQSWRFTIDPGNRQNIYLFLETERLLPATDPFNRQIMLGHGSLLEYMMIAAAHHGYKAQVTLFPDGEIVNEDTNEIIETKPVARITIVPDSTLSSPGEYNLLFKRHTNRTPFFKNSFDTSDTDILLKVDQYEGQRLIILDQGDELERLKELVTRGVKIESTTEYTMNESNDVFRYNEKDKTEFPWGLTLASGKNSAEELYKIQKLATKFPLSWKGMGKVWFKNDSENIESAPALAMIISTGNTRQIQIESGRLYARLCLKGEELGYSLHPLSQTLQEYPEMADLYKTVHSEHAMEGETIQLIFRIGKADAVSHASPRLDLTDIVEIVEN